MDPQRGDRVEVTGGRRGVVLSVRMAPPDYATVAAVSVSLDERAGTRGYAGTTFPAEQVRVVGDEQAVRP